MRNTKLIGDVTETKVLSALVEKGWAMSVPWGENCKYDLVGDDGDKIHRIQCKTGRLRNGSVIFRTHTSHVHRGGGLEGYKGKADLFGVYCPDNGSIYLIPVDEVPDTYAYLRVEPTKNNQSEGIRFAKEYKL